MPLAHNNFERRGPPCRDLLKIPVPPGPVLPAATCCRRSCLRFGWFWVQSIMKMLPGIALPVLLFPPQKKSIGLLTAGNLKCCRGREKKKNPPKLSSTLLTTPASFKCMVWQLARPWAQGQMQWEAFTTRATAHECRRGGGYRTASKKQAKKWDISRKL